MEAYQGRLRLRLPRAIDGGKAEVSVRSILSLLKNAIEF
jgi:hypothetical protein